jgi:hypothetical protein
VALILVGWRLQEKTLVERELAKGRMFVTAELCGFGDVGYSFTVWRRGSVAAGGDA